MGKVSPLIVEIVIFYCTRSGSDFPDLGAPAIKDAIIQLLDAHILGVSTSNSGVTYIATAKAEAWLEMICDTPLPVMKWVRP